MNDATGFALGAAGYALLILGLIGSVLPVVPGPLFIWFGALVWSWSTGFQQLGWPWLVVMGLLAIAAWSSDLFINTVISRRAGASWKSISGAIVGGIVGGILLNGLAPILGAIVGAACGALIGLWLIEYLDKRNLQASNKAVRAYLLSMVLASALELSLSLTMVGIFVWRAFLS